MTINGTPSTTARIRFVLPRFARFLGVAGLCLMVLPATGFWVDSSDRDRGMFALRVRIDYSATLPAPSMYDAHLTTSRSRERSVLPATPLSLDRTRYRATLRDMPKVMPATGDASENSGRNLIDLVDGRVALALADNIHLPIRGLGTPRPSQTYSFWSKSGTFIPADGHMRTADPTDTIWLTDPDWKLGGECITRAETSLSADMQRLALRMQTAWVTSPHPKSRQYMDLISESSKRFGLPPQLIYAIMRTESAFNPFAVSNAGALGLMQLVPESAGNEVHAYLTGKAGRPTTKMLFNPENNIEYGSAYLHLLATRYFATVSNTASRELCMIAAYNAGPRAVLRVFGTSPEASISAINALSPEALFKTLSRKMPAEETRQYVGKVLANINSYPR